MNTTQRVRGPLRWAICVLSVHTKKLGVGSGEGRGTQVEKYPMGTKSNDKDCNKSRKFYEAGDAPRRWRIEV